jgi:hypothetical protein
MLQPQDLLLPHPLILKLGLSFTITAMFAGCPERFHDSSVRRLQFMRHVRWNAICMYFRTHLLPTTAHLLVNTRDYYFSDMFRLTIPAILRKTIFTKAQMMLKKIFLCVNNPPEE